MLHNAGSGNDHVSVGWQLADGTLERPIPVYRLSSFVAPTVLAVDSEIQNPLGRIKLYPNPVEDKLFLEASHTLAKEGNWTILDLQGRVVKEVEKGLTLDNSQPQEINLSGLNMPAGLYLLRIQSGNAHQLIRFMKK